MDRAAAERRPPPEVVLAIVEAAHASGRAGLNVSTSGNLSARIDERSAAISAARTQLARLTPDEVVRFDLGRAISEDAESSSGPAPSGPHPRPSRETPMHRAVYEALDHVGAVLHFQSPYATILACREDPPPSLDFIPEVPVYVGSVGRVPYLPPGSERLGEAVARELQRPDVGVVLLGNHGQLAVGRDLSGVIERATFFEFACRLAVLSEGRPALRRFEEEEREQLRSYRPS